MYENICNTDLPVFVRREDIQAIKGLAKDLKIVVSLEIKSKLTCYVTKTLFS